MINVQTVTCTVLAHLEQEDRIWLAVSGGA